MKHPTRLSKLADKLKEKGVNPATAREFPWKGPESPDPQGGISQSLLQKFLACRARFKVHVIEGLSGPDHFSAALSYGNMWHVCEEAVERTDGTKRKRAPWRDALDAYIVSLSQRYPLDRDKIAHWYSLCEAQFPIYLDYWQEEGEIVGREPLLREQTFHVPYRLPSGKIVYLRGKWDGIDLVHSPRIIKGAAPIVPEYEDGLYLYENKTKSSIDADKLKKQLSFDLQTMFYLIALREYALSNPVRTLARDKGAGASVPIKGVLYNVVRRSQHKSADAMVKKIHEDIDAARGGEWFGRWTVDITRNDIEVFKRDFLAPVLEQLCLWYKIQTNPRSLFHVNAFDLTRMMHWRHPNGCWNEVDDSGGSIVDHYMNTGSAAGLVRVTTLYPELEP